LTYGMAAVTGSGSLPPTDRSSPGRLVKVRVRVPRWLLGAKQTPRLLFAPRGVSDPTMTMDDHWEDPEVRERFVKVLGERIDDGQYRIKGLPKDRGFRDADNFETIETGSPE